MANPSTVDAAGRAIAGLLTYNPGPGIYSRLERAVEAMPENVRVQELPGLIKRYKDGVPGWELKAVDLDSLVAGRDVVPRSEILAAVKERSPVYTHKEVMLGGRPPVIKDQPHHSLVNFDGAPLRDDVPSYQPTPAPLGQGISHARPAYEDYGQGGTDYAELLLTQPGAYGYKFGSHWDGLGKGSSEAVAHARFDTHGDALRINELQSDLGIYNRQIREKGGLPQQPPKMAGESDGAYAERLEGLGYEVEWSGGGWEPTNAAINFPLEDAWSDLLIKRLALEAARQGHRAIEVASPRAIADKVGGNIDNYEHFYGKVVPGAIERLGRKMGGLVDESASIAPSTGSQKDMWAESSRRLHHEIADYASATGLTDWQAANAYGRLVETFEAGGAIYPEAQRLYQFLMRKEGLMADEAAERMTELMWLADRQAKATGEYRIHHHSGRQYGAARSQPPGRRYLMSDEMRKRILTEGIPAAIAIGIGTDAVLDRLCKEAPQPQMR